MLKLAEKKLFFTRAPLDESKYVLIEWETASEFADTLNYCSNNMESWYSTIADPISRAHDCLCCKHAPVDWCHEKGSTVCALLAINSNDSDDIEYSDDKKTGTYPLAGMVFHKSCLHFLRHVMHCVIQGDTKWGTLSSDQVSESEMAEGLLRGREPGPTAAA